MTDPAAGVTRPLHLFEGFGIEIEYAIVDDATLAVRPIADDLLRELAGEPASDVTLGDIECSNELVLHVIELKTSAPAPELGGLPACFDEAVRRLSSVLASRGARLMPTAMHPLMDPATETRLWPHDNGEIYATFDRIFGCRGHGWSNLQSVHLNLPFQGDGEFGRLHAAIRLLLPLLPALAASSPIVEGVATASLDNRLEFYQGNSRRIPSIAGHVVPEPLFSRRAYEAGVFEPIARDLSPHDPEGVLEPEWTNSRGAIARFVRDSIEIRVVDTQECPAADLAIAAAQVAVLRALTAERWVSGRDLFAFETEPLAALFRAAVRDGGEAVVRDASFLRTFGVTGPSATLSEIWSHLVATLVEPASEFRPALDVIVNEGCLAERIRRRFEGRPPDRAGIVAVYRELCDCLAEGRLFR